MDQYAGQSTGQKDLPPEEAAYACPTCGLKVDRSVTICPRDGSVISDYSSTERLLDNRYQVLSLVASGGMGSIYKAKQPALNKIVAVKMLRVDSRSEAAWIRFQQEAKVFSHLEHRNIIKVYDFGETADKQPFMVMDYVDGINLQELISEEKTLPIEEVFNIFRQICSGMAHAHAHQIFHRDLKPSNIMLSQLDSVNPQVRIVDFGIAKVLNNQSEGQNLTQTGEVFGSPHYMSPEQAVGKRVEASSDIYSLGCIMHEALTGSVPLSGATAFDTLMKHMHEKPPSLRQANPQGVFSDELVALVLKALSKDPLKRFQSMHEMSTAIDLLPESIKIANKRGPTSVFGSGVSAPTSKFPKIESASKQSELETFIENKKVIWLGALIAVILVLGVIYINFGSVNPQQAFRAASFFHLTKPESVTPPVVAIEPPAKFQRKGPLSDQPPAPTDMSKVLKGKADDGISLAPPPPTPTPTSVEKEETSSQIGSTTIDLEKVDSDSRLAESVAQNPQASTVILKGKLITDMGIQQLKVLPIERLVIQGTTLTEKGFEILTQFPKLQQLDLRNNINLSDKILLPLAGMKKLKMLDLSHNPQVTDATLSILPPSLQVLGLQGNYNLTEKGISDVCKLSNLTLLDVSKTPLTDDDIKSLPKLTKLERLFVGETCLTDRSMPTLGKLPVKELGLQKTKITKKGLMDLVNLPQVVSMSTKGCPYVSKKDREEYRTQFKGMIHLDPLD